MTANQRGTENTGHSDRGEDPDAMYNYERRRERSARNRWGKGRIWTAARSGDRNRRQERCETTNGENGIGQRPSSRQPEKRKLGADLSGKRELSWRHLKSRREPKISATKRLDRISAKRETRPRSMRPSGKSIPHQRATARKRKTGAANGRTGEQRCCGSRTEEPSGGENQIRASCGARSASWREGNQLRQNLSRKTEQRARDVNKEKSQIFGTNEQYKMQTRVFY
jgi:hypothetical protein